MTTIATLKTINPHTNPDGSARALEWAPNNQAALACRVVSREGWEVRQGATHYVARPPNEGPQIIYPCTPSDWRWRRNFLRSIRKHPQCPNDFKHMNELADEILARGKSTTQEKRRPIMLDTTTPSEVTPSEIKGPFACLPASGKASICTNQTGNTCTLIRFLGLAMNGSPGAPVLPVSYEAIRTDDIVTIMVAKTATSRMTRLKSDKAPIAAFQCRNSLLDLIGGCTSTVTTWTNDGNALSVKIPHHYIKSDADVEDPVRHTVDTAPDTTAGTAAGTAATQKPKRVYTKRCEKSKYGGVGNSAPKQAALSAGSQPAADAAVCTVNFGKRPDACNTVQLPNTFSRLAAKHLIDSLNEQVKLSGGSLTLWVDQENTLRGKIVVVEEF